MTRNHGPDRGAVQGNLPFNGSVSRCGSIQSPTYKRGTFGEAFDVVRVEESSKDGK